MEKKSKKSSALIHIVTPFVLLAFCVGILIIALIKPADKAKVYLNLAFMDNLKSDPSSAGSGLVLRNNEIIDDYSGEISDEGEFIYPKFGELYAVMTCSAFDISVPVYWGSNSELFEHGACQSTGSVIIGDNGNTVISAHEDTFFAELYKLKKGDIVTLKTNYGEFFYKVSETIAFNKKENKYVSPSENSKLTLYTCKRNVLGSSDERIGVVCEPTEKRFYKITGEENNNE
ncbi:class D sortase [Ruminococcus flavefaciens]|uniref:class D sortase n=1 Tax=Ruminococcus flavefaciens TaxID=1265 RepID=UPI0026F1FFB2|nr:class D sortase [Ruminococcus flavefaciens]MDD7516058.1 class D sortase [Ruminococcus flavefaciens]MDY5690425.1 class D sortase [Ruminococcus flavefaciens]